MSTTKLDPSTTIAFGIQAVGWAAAAQRKDGIGALMALGGMLATWVALSQAREEAARDRLRKRLHEHKEQR